jgi:Flp pilus assembly pilin Flp
MKRRRGQGTLEYVLILAAIIVAIIAGKAAIQAAVEKNMDDATTVINDATDNMPGLN